jgi:hypothetical protein
MSELGDVIWGVAELLAELADLADWLTRRDEREEGR